MELAIISGKGGTGKTSLVGSLAALAPGNIFVDCDVDAANLRLILGAENGHTHDFIAGSRAVINPNKCTGSGECEKYCRYEAVKMVGEATAGSGRQATIDEYSCEGCGVCVQFCPNDAIAMKDIASGQWFVSPTKYGPLVHARLGIAEANSGKLVSLLRKEAGRIATREKIGLIVIDGPPGLSCPVIASVTGVDYALIVTEASVSSLHDMQRLVELTGHFGLATGLCINKFDINEEMTSEIQAFAEQKNIPVLGKIPFEPGITRAQLSGMPYLEYADNEAARQIKNLWQNLEGQLKQLENHAPNRADRLD